MFNKLSYIIFILLLTTIVNAQKPRPTPDLSKYNRDPNSERIKKMSIRLAVGSDYSEKDSKSRISKDDSVIIKVIASVSDQRIIAFRIGSSDSKFTFFTPLLLGNNDIPFEYPPNTKEKIKQGWEELEQRKLPNTISRNSGPGAFIYPNRENVIGYLNIADWYGKLSPGKYKVMVRFGFGDSEKENKIQSKPITFEVY